MAETKADALKLQPRDLVLLRGLFESRVMTTDHAAALYFDGKGEAAKKRLQKLKSAGFIAERPRRTFEPSVLFLTRNCLGLLQGRGVLAEYPPFDLPSLDRRARVSDLTIRHELEVMDVKVAFQAAVKHTRSCSIAEFCTWPLLHEFTVYHPGRNGAEVPMRPDGFIRLHQAENREKFEHAFFLELDRSNETQDRLIGKAVCYFEYYKSGGFAIRNSGTREEFKKFPFRVLLVVPNSERRNNTAERLLQNTPTILTMVWLSTFAEVTADPFGPIWIRPSEYREATKGTQFDAERQFNPTAYRRDAKREAFVESNIKKMRLLEN